MKSRGVACVPPGYGMRASRLLVLHRSGCTFLGSSRRPAGVPEAAKGQALAGAQCLSEVTAGAGLAGTSLLASVMRSHFGIWPSELCESGGWQGLLHPAKQDDHLCMHPRSLQVRGNFSKWFPKKDPCVVQHCVYSHSREDCSFEQYSYYFSIWGN